jgi:hypothetical protein
VHPTDPNQLIGLGKKHRGHTQTQVVELESGICWRISARAAEVLSNSEFQFCISGTNVSVGIFHHIVDMEKNSAERSFCECQASQDRYRDMIFML